MWVTESVMGIKTGDSSVVIEYQVDECTGTWSADQFVAHSHIYPGLTGGCEDYAFLGSGCC